MGENIKVETKEPTKKKFTILRDFDMENTCIFYRIQLCWICCRSTIFNCNKRNIRK